ncbi:unnamed protein product [Soboliphyme baturini]|uniref:Protein tweety homolog n=1 Tax=Soboliphyme baturini TaxID=241478 RepID=A0A183IS22_9BILA|nr:unnamed protein product [Soboliphyme baturini]
MTEPLELVLQLRAAYSETVSDIFQAAYLKTEFSKSRRQNCPLPLIFPACFCCMFGRVHCTHRASDLCTILPVFSPIVSFVRQEGCASGQLRRSYFLLNSVGPLFHGFLNEARDKCLHYRGNETYNYGPLPPEGKSPIEVLINAISGVNVTLVMSGLERLLQDSYKFIGLADDLHDIKGYLNDMRLCFLALTITLYVGVFLYGLAYCINRTRRHHRPNNPAMYDEEVAWDNHHSHRPNDSYAYRSAAYKKSQFNRHRYGGGAMAAVHEELGDTSACKPNGPLDTTVVSSEMAEQEKFPITT